MKEFVTPTGVPFERLESNREVIDLIRRLGDDIWKDCTGLIDYRFGRRVVISSEPRRILLTGIVRLVLYTTGGCVYFGRHLQVVRAGYGYRVAFYQPGSLEVF